MQERYIKVKKSSIVFCEETHNGRIVFVFVNYKQIGRKVEKIRNAKSLTQAELAGQIDVSAPYISLIETAAKKASLTFEDLSNISLA